MDEVVVTAIGIKQQKRKVGYATQEVPTEVLEESKTMNIGNALSGQIAGLIVNNPTGVFQAPSFNLRGKKTLIVIDGIPVETDLFYIPSQHIYWHLETGKPSITDPLMGYGKKRM